MDFTQIDDRLDLDNAMGEIAKKFPQNEDDFLFFFRGKVSTGELFVASSSELQNFGYLLWCLGTQEESFKIEIEKASNLLNEYSKL